MELIKYIKDTYTRNKYVWYIFKAKYLYKLKGYFVFCNPQVENLLKKSIFVKKYQTIQNLQTYEYNHSIFGMDIIMEEACYKENVYLLSKSYGVVDKLNR